MHDPAEPTSPQELPGYTPEELPVRGPDIAPGQGDLPATM